MSNHVTVGIIGGAMSGKTRFNLAAALSKHRIDADVVVRLDTPRALEYYEPDLPPPVSIPDMTFYKVCKRSRHWAHFLPYLPVGYERTSYLFVHATMNQPPITPEAALKVAVKFRKAIKNRSRLRRLSRRWNHWDREATELLREYGAIARRYRNLPVDYADLDNEYFTTL